MKMADKGEMTECPGITTIYEWKKGNFLNIQVIVFSFNKEKLNTFCSGLQLQDSPYIQRR